MNYHAPALSWYYVSGDRVLVCAHSAADAAMHFMHSFGEGVSYEIDNTGKTVYITTEGNIIHEVTEFHDNYEEPVKEGTINYSDIEHPMSDTVFDIALTKLQTGYCTHTYTSPRRSRELTDSLTQLTSKQLERLDMVLWVLYGDDFKSRHAPMPKGLDHFTEDLIRLRRNLPA